MVGVVIYKYTWIIDIKTFPVQYTDWAPRGPGVREIETRKCPLAIRNIEQIWTHISVVCVKCLLLPSSDQDPAKLGWGSLNFEISSIRPPTRPPGPGLVPEKLPKKLKFDMQASFNPTRTNIKTKKWCYLPPFQQSFRHKTVISSQSKQGIWLKNFFNKSC